MKKTTLSMRDLRRFVENHKHVAEDTVVCLIEENPSENYDNSGFPATMISHDGGGTDSGDIGVIYIAADGIEQKIIPAGQQ